MAKPYSLDLRNRAVAAVKSGGLHEEVSKIFSVGRATLVRWLRRDREEGSPAPRRMGGHRPYILEPYRDWILEKVKDGEDFILSDLRDELSEKGIDVSISTLWRFLDRNGITFKKNDFSKRTRSGKRHKI